MAIEIKDRVEVPRESGFKRYVGLTHLDSGSLKIWRWGSTQDVEKQKMLFKSGDIIFGRRNAYLRRVSVADFDGVCSAHAMVLRARPQVVLPEFLPCFMQAETFWQAALRNSAGSLSPTINWSNLAKEEFTLPPLEEQRRIAEVLQAIQDCRNKYVGVEGSLRQVQRATLTRAFTTDLTNISDWPTLDSLCARIGDGTHLPPPFTETGIPFLLVSNITSGEVDWYTEKFVSEESYQELTKTWRPHKGDLLYSLVGTFGVPAKVETEERFTFQRHIGLIRTNPDSLLADYLYWYLRSPAGYQQATWRAEGLAQKTVTLGALRAFRIPWRPIPEQKVYIEQFENIEAQRAGLSRRESEIRRTMASFISTQMK